MAIVTSSSSKVNPLECFVGSLLLWANWECMLHFVTLEASPMFFAVKRFS